MTVDIRTGPHNGHLMVHALKKHKDRPVLYIGDQVLTGQQFADETSKFIQALEELGLGVGSPVGMLALNRPEVLVSIGAGQLLGLRRTALHPLGSADDHAYVLNDAGVETLIIDPYFAGRAAELMDKVPGLKQVLTFGPADLGVDINEVAARQTARPLVARDLPSDSINGITYTGGTTGKPKGVIGTTGSIATMTTIQLAEWEWPQEPRFLMCTPLSHAGAAFFLPVLMAGGSMVVLPRFDPAEVLEAIEKYQINSTMVVPTMLYALMDHPDSHTRDLSSLETIYYGAAAINPVRLAEAVERFGPIFAQYYGQSEAPMVITYLAKADHLKPERLTSCGRPSAFIRAALLDEDGNRVPQGEPGEICVAGPLLSGGYWNLPEETAGTFRDGWLRTGDVAREDDDGFWFIVDRTKDMIVTGGFNVFPREVEDVISEHPAVAQVGVVGTPDEKWGEAVTAIVVLRADADRDEAAIAKLTEEIYAAVKERKGSVQAPKQVIIADALPMTPLGKPDKKALRAPFWVGKDRAV
jgi:fatty-acyl-CoA synthase